MDVRKALLFIGLILCWTNQAHSQFQCACNDTQQCSPTGQLQLAALVQGAPGPKGSRGHAGDPGRRGAPGPYGPKGETVLNEDQFQTLQQALLKNISANLSEVAASVMDIQRAFTKCGIYSTSWRRVAHIDMTDSTARCPDGLLQVFNSTTKQRACGWNASRSCFNHSFPTGWTYTHVCGHVNGYQSGNTKAFLGKPDPSTRYADGVLITRGEGHKHLWTYAVGKSNEDGAGIYCMNGTANGSNPFFIPGFVGNDTFCESEHVNSTEEIAWEDTLWDEGDENIQCNTPGDLSCLSPGWFLTQVSHTNDRINVRWCTDEGAVYTNILEIWVQ